MPGRDESGIAKVWLFVEGVIMTKSKKGDVTKENTSGSDIGVKAEENFSSFPLDRTFEPNVDIQTPSGMYFRVDDGEHKSYPPKAHMTLSSREGHGDRNVLSVRIGDPNPQLNVDANSVDFYFPMALERQINNFSIRYDAAIGGSSGILVLRATYFNPDLPNPDIPRTYSRATTAERWDGVFSFGLEGRSTIVSVRLSMMRVNPPGLNSLTMEINSIVWHYQPEGGGGR